MAGFRKENSDGSQLSPIAVLILLLLAGSIGYSAFNKYHGGTSDDNKNAINTDDMIVVDMCDPDNDDYGKLYYNPVDDNHIIEDDMERFIDNEILIVVNDGVTKNQVQQLSEKYNAEIVGEIEVTGDYQLRFSDISSKEDLDNALQLILKEDIIAEATLNYVAEISESKQTEECDGFYYGKQWQGDLQNFNNAKGKSWGLEAISTTGAWDKLTHTSRTINPVKIGLIDNGFYINHEDLQFAEVFYDNGSNGLSSGKIAHGTHVAGTMAAKNNDTTGICGIYPYGAGRLYGVSNCEGEGTIKYNDSLMSEKIAFAELIVRNVKVINTSRGFSWNAEKDFKNWYDKTSTDSHFTGYDACADFLGAFFQKMLDKGYDFVIVSAAGNNSRNLPTKFDCRYSFWLNGISQAKYPDVYNRIIVVGAVDYKMNIAAYSDGGNRVDIYAPGGDTGWGNKEVYSTLANNKYGYMHGTSMAAPHVSGVAAMVWSANNSLTGADVKESITRRWSGRCTSCHMVDAYMAVGHALGEEDTGDNSNIENGGVLCYVVERFHEDNKISGANVTLKNIDTGETFNTTTDDLGHFEIMLPEGKYSLSVKADGFEDYEWPDGNNYQNPIVVKNEGINYLDDWIKLRRIGKNEVQLSVFALEADDLDPITNKDISITLSNSELVCTNPKQTINTVDGSVIFNISMGEKNRNVDSKVTLHIDGYKDFVLDTYRFGNDPADMLMFEAFFELDENASPSSSETPDPGESKEISDDEDEFFEYLEDDYEDYDYGVPLEDMIAWTYYNGHLYALYDYAVSAHIMNLVTLIDPSVHLVTITDAAEQSAVEELIAVGGRDIYYTGGMVDKNGSLYTINGENATYSNWYSGCPESYNEAGYDDIVVIYRGSESSADKDEDFGVWLEVLEDEYSYLDFFDFDLGGITRGIIIEWDNPGAYGLNQN